MQRIDGDAAGAQAARQFLGEQRVRQFGLSVERERLVEPATVEVVEHDAFGRRLLEGGAAADDDDAPCPVAHQRLDAVHQREVPD